MSGWLFQPCDFRLLQVGLLSILTAAVVSAAPSVTSSDLLRQARQADAELRNQQALQLALQAATLDPKNTEIRCLVAKQYSQLASDARDAGKTAEEKRLDDAALGQALGAVSDDPRSALAHASLAICYARSSLLEGAKRKIEYSKLVQAEALRAVSIDPKQDVALHVLGAWNFNMVKLNPLLKKLAEIIYGKFPDASLASSAEYFHRACAAAPNRLMHPAALAQTYAAMGDKEKARRALVSAEALPIREKEDAFLLKQAREAVSKM